LDKARQYAEGLNELEVKVEEATNSDKWGPHGSLMQGALLLQMRFSISILSFRRGLIQ
jgi:hypothetical protein